MGGHDFDRVEIEDAGYVLVCECGWRSRAEASAGAIGYEWDAHRASVGVLR